MSYCWVVNYLLPTHALKTSFPRHIWTSWISGRTPVKEQSITLEKSGRKPSTAGLFMRNWSSENMHWRSTTVIRTRTRSNLAKKQSAFLQKLAHHGLSNAKIELVLAKPESGESRQEQTNAHNWITRCITNVRSALTSESGPLRHRRNTHKAADADGFRVVSGSFQPFIHSLDMDCSNGPDRIRHRMSRPGTHNIEISAHQQVGVVHTCTPLQFRQQVGRTYKR